MATERIEASSLDELNNKVNTFLNEGRLIKRIDFNSSVNLHGNVVFTVVLEYGEEPHSSSIAAHDIEY